MTRSLSDPVTLPCGLELPNRTAKGAMAENMANTSERNMPSDKHIAAYSRWADGGWGMLITGNVMVNGRHRGQPGDVVVPDVDDVEALKRWKEWADASQAHGTPTVVQISHPGRQSPLGAGTRGLFGKTVAPSAIPLNLGSQFVARVVRKLLFGTPKALTIDGIKEVIDDFVRTAKTAHQAGFKGVQLHGAHGYLLSLFLSPKMNLRTDDYGGSTKNRSRIVVEILQRIRAETSPEFCVGIKLNSTDFQQDRIDEALEQIRFITQAGVDFIEVSGGSYESPDMAMGPKDEPVAASTSKREAFFLSFANLLRKTFPDTIIMVTGGLRSREGMKQAIQEGSVDLIGIARPAAVVPDLPKKIILNKGLKDEEAKIVLEKVKGGWMYKIVKFFVPLNSVGAGLETMFYTSQIVRMGRGLQPLMANIAY